MSIINLFNPKNPISALNAASASYYSESNKNIAEKFKDIKQFEPPIDFTGPPVDASINFITASNWCHYGSLELYYEYGFKKVYQTYPYDGSAYEKNLYRTNSSQIDNYIFDNLYPKSTGYAIFMPNAFTQSAAATSGSTKYQLATDPEYITTFGGPHTASGGMIGKPLHQTFSGSNKYDVSLRRESNLEFDFTYGNTIEFWMNKGNYIDADYNEVIFDLSNSGTGTEKGRLRIEMDPAANYPFIVTIESSSATATQTVGQSTIGAASGVPSNGWHHYAFSFLSNSSGTLLNFFYDGNLTEQHQIGTGFARVTGSGASNGLKSSIGALVGAVAGFSGTTKGYGQFSGSIDEFRYWKYERPADLIKLNYFKGVDGGTNTDDDSYQLGFYYKFNEGITQIDSTDSTVLDYSGRISNGVWTGYNSNSRNTGSAITLSGVETEVADPIVRSNHPTVIADMETYRLTGSFYDQENHSYFYNLFPQWIREEDLEESGLLRELAHIGASYFDTIHHQLSFYKNVKHKEYLSTSSKPITFSDVLVENAGLTVSNMFINSKIYEKVLNQDENELYDMTLFDVKNQIYHNIYNNMDSILKSKGTVEAFRNFLRSFGINEQIIKLRMYTDNDTYFLNDNYKLETTPIKFVNFYNNDNLDGSVIQATSSISDKSWVEYTETDEKEKFSSFTAEANILFPLKRQPGENGHIFISSLTSSLFGFHRPNVSDTNDYTWADSGYSGGGITNLQVYALKDKGNGSDVKFQLTDTGGTINLTSSYFQDVYDNTTWNISMRIKPSGSVFTGFSAYSQTTPNYILEFYGANYHNGEKRNTFHLTRELSGSERNLLFTDKRFYIGAHTTNFTGSIIHPADTRISSFRVWDSHLSNEELNSHAKDFTSFGVLSSSKNPTLFENDISTYFPKMDSLVLNWDFGLVTGSDSSGQFLVYDISSGSSAHTHYGWHSNSVGLRHGGLGRNFLTSSTKVVDKNYIISARSPEPGNALLDDLINIREEFEALKTDYNDVTDNFFSIEKSPYAVLSTEMLKVFSLSKDLNYLIGNPTNRYRSEYKEIGDLRDIYFRNIENEIDVERYFDYYKWIDLSFDHMIKQLIPFSTRHSETVSNVIESHILERPKYQNKLPNLRTFTATEGAAHGVHALNYPWRVGHAPISSNPNVNCFWQRARKERDDIPDRESIRKVLNDIHPIVTIHHSQVEPTFTIYEGSTYVRRSLKPSYRLSVDKDRTLHTGTNYDLKKDRILFHSALEPHGNLLATGIANAPSVPQNVINVGGESLGILDTRDCDDTIGAVSGDYDVDENNYFNSIAELGKFFPDDYRFTLKGHSILPFNLKNDIISTGYNSQVHSLFRYDAVITNLHTDVIDDSNVIPMQGPFTETHVGGHQSRHVAINKYDVDKSSLSEIVFSTPGAAATLEFTISSLSNLDFNDTITIRDHANTQITFAYSPYYDIDNGRWTTVEELLTIINNRLDVTATQTSSSPITISLTMNALNAATAATAYVFGTNEIAITQIWTGGVDPSGGTSTATHVGLDNPSNRPEAWGLVIGSSPNSTTTDGILGFVGADYGGSSYPNPLKLRATRFRSEHVKRPLNVRNIQYDESSSFVGNYRKGVEIVTLGKAAQKRWYRDAYDANLVLPDSISNSLPNTTNYHTLVAQAPLPIGNIFGHFNTTTQGSIPLNISTNNRQPDAGTTTTFQAATAVLHFDVERNPNQVPLLNLKFENRDSIAGIHQTLEFTFDPSQSNGLVVQQGTVATPHHIVNVTPITGQGSIEANWEATFTSFAAQASSIAYAGLTTGIGVATNPQVEKASSAYLFLQQKVGTTFYYPDVSICVPNNILTQPNGLNTADCNNNGGTFIGRPVIAATVTGITVEEVPQIIVRAYNPDMNPSVSEVHYYANNGTLRHTTTNNLVTQIHQPPTFEDFANQIFDYDDFIASLAACIDFNQGDYVDVTLAAAPGVNGSTPQNTIFLNQKGAGSSGDLVIDYNSGTKAWPNQEHDSTILLNGNGDRYLTETLTTIDQNLLSQVPNSGIGAPSSFSGGFIRKQINFTELLQGTLGNSTTIVDVNQLVHQATSTTTSNFAQNVYNFQGGQTITIGSGDIDVVIERPRTDLTSSTYEINTRFSAPGGPEIQSIGYLDVQSNSYSAYNALPFRNLTVRGRSSGEDSTIRSAIHTHPTTPIGGGSIVNSAGESVERRGLRTLLQQRMGKAGTDHMDDTSNSEVESATYPSFGSFHKVNSNRRFKLAETGSQLQSLGNSFLDGTKPKFAELVDNGYINKPIPSQDVGYSWIRNSYGKGPADLNDPLTLASFILGQTYADKRFCNYSPEDFFNDGLFSVFYQSYTTRHVDPTLSTADQNTVNTKFDLATDLLALGQSEIGTAPWVIGYAPPRGTQRVSSSVFGFFEQSSHILPTISDVICCSDLAAPEIFYTIPDQAYRKVDQDGDGQDDKEPTDGIPSSGTIPGFVDSVDRTFVVVDSVGKLDPTNDDIELTIENGVNKIKLDFNFSDCCEASDIQYGMTVFGLSGGGLLEGQISSEFTPITYSNTIPNFPSNNGVDKTIEFSDQDNAEVFVKIYIKDCEGQETVVKLTFKNAKHI